MRQNDGTPAAPAAADSMAGALEQYLAAAEAGTAPPRDEFLARYPQLAEDLDACLAALRLIGQAAEGPRSVAAEFVGAEPPEQARGQLGDFRLIREVGRGGMGVVYEAEQVSLGRRVALKVLPFAATLDPRQLQRFHNEARAAASLDHPHIVHVHAVGCERAVHFYAMQFIEGQTLAAMIADLRQRGGRPTLPEAQPTTPPVPETPAPAPDTSPRAAASTERPRLDRAYFRRVAELGIQAAEALDHAHTLGIVHRDVKPANLLLDGRGGLWVTDFGLAHIQSDARLTMTGDLVGTLRYMSPEQALAKRVVVDHRTDVYSLGATLYELLTLEPAFAGGDRQELLRQIAFEEPKRPRRVNKAIPAELETIVLKAMEKNPAERYATAKELAEDLRRFLADEPIRARPAGLVRRLRKWGRRHAAAVTAAAVCLLVTLAALIGSVGWVLGDRTARQREAEGKVREALEAAAPGLRQGSPWDPALISAAQRAEAQLNGGTVGQDLRRRVEQLQKDVQMLTDLERIRLDQAGLRKGHFDRIGSAPKYARAFRGYGIDVEALGPEAAAALVQASTIREHVVAGLDDWAYSLSPSAKAEQRQNAKRLLAVARLVDPDPWRNRLREMVLASDFRDLEQLARSAPVEELTRATVGLLGHLVADQAKASGPILELLRRAQQRFPDDFWINHDLAFALSNRVQPPQLEEAIGFYRAAVALRPQSPGARLNYANCLDGRGDTNGAIAELEEAIRLKKDYAEAHYDLGIVLGHQGKLDEAIACCKEAVRLEPDNAAAHCNLAGSFADKGEWDEALAECQEAVRLDPDDAMAHYGLGVILKAKGNLDTAMAEYREAIRIKEDYPEAHCNLGIALAEKGETDKAIACYKEAIRLKPDLVQAHDNLGNALAENGKSDEAIACYKEAIRVKPDYAAPHSNLGVALVKKGDLNRAIAEFKEAIRLKEDYAEAHNNLSFVLRDKGQFAEALPHFRRGHELGSKDPRWPHPSAQWVKECERLVELDGKLPWILVGEAGAADARECLYLAVICSTPAKQMYAAAAGFYTAALAAEPRLNGGQPSVPRYNAACAAALAGCGAGKDAAKLTDAECAGLRKQALDWLGADLDAWRGLLDKDPAKARPAVALQMQHWLSDRDFNGVRGPEALAKLPEAEREGWRKLWAEVADTLAKAQGKTATEQKPGVK